MTPAQSTWQTRTSVADLDPEDERIGSIVVQAAFVVHSQLGPGLLESIYEACFCHELGKRGLAFRRQAIVPITYDGMTFQEGLRLDVLIENRVICELKAVEAMLPVFEAQLLSYMRLMDKRLGYLINFNVPLIKHGIRRLLR
jgi:GxxExxY protein